MAYRNIPAASLYHFPVPFTHLLEDAPGIYTDTESVPLYICRSVIVSMSVMITVSSYNIRHRDICSGNKSDQSNQNDGYVYGDGPPAHTFTLARRLDTAAWTMLLYVLRARFIAIIVILVIEFPIGLWIRTFQIFIVLVVVFPERGQMNDGRTQQTQDGEEHGSKQRDDRRQVGNDGGNQNYNKHNYTKMTNTKRNDSETQLNYITYMCLVS